MSEWGVHLKAPNGWYHGALSRQRAAELIHGGIDGTFLVRDSSSLKGDYVLSVREKGKEHHYIIENREGNFHTKERAFKTLPELIEYYMHYKLDYTRLKVPVDYATGLAVKTAVIDISQLTMGRALGEGVFGCVKEATWKRPGFGNTLVAVKMLKAEASEQASEEFLKEAKVMMELNHENVVQVLGVCLGRVKLLVTEICHLGSLKGYLEEEKGKLPVDTLVMYAAQCACGMSYLEKQRFVHRDLAARNLLVATKTVIKITDFGLSRALDVGQEYYKYTGGVVPVRWLAPESINYLRFTHASDVWSFGVCLWEIMSWGEEPYGNIPNNEVVRVVEKGKQLDPPIGCPGDVYQVMAMCWAYDPKMRPCFQELHESLFKISPYELNPYCNE